MSQYKSTTCLLKADFLETWSSNEDLSSGYDSGSNTEPKQHGKETIPKSTKSQQFRSVPSWPYEQNSAYQDSDSETDSEPDSTPFSDDDTSEESSDEYSDDDVATDSASIKYTCIDSLCDSLTYILSMPDMCDVMFLVGPDRTPVYGIKSLLTTRSRVFFQQVLAATREAEKSPKSRKLKRTKNKPINLSKKITIHVPDMQPEVFKKLIKFIHCGLVDVTVHDVIGLLSAALRYHVTDLSAICRDFITRGTSSAMASTLLESIERRAEVNKEMTFIKNKLLKRMNTSKPITQVQKDYQTSPKNETVV